MSAGSLWHGEVSAPGRGSRWSRDRAPGQRVPVITATVAVAVLTALAAVLRFYGLGRQGFWFDEANTALLVRFAPGKMLGLIPQTESTPPLYYCVAWVWSRVLGADEAGLRSLSAVAGVLVVPIAYGAAARLVSGQRPARHPAALEWAAPESSGRRAGLICAALAACNPFLIWYSQEARSYELLVLLTGLALLAFALVRRDPSPRLVAVWAVACALALATHYFAAVIIVPQAVWLAVEHRRARAVQVGFAVVALCGLALIPLALSQRGTGHDMWIGHTPLRLRLAQIIPQFLIGTNAPARQPLKLAAMALAVVALGLLVTRASAGERRGALVAGVLAVAGLAISLALIGIGFDDVITRNLIELWLPAAVVVSAGLAATRGRATAVAGVIVTVALCAIGVFATIGIDVNRSMQRPDWRLVARALGSEPPAGQTRAILVQHYKTLLPLSLYLPHLRVLRAPERVSRLDVISMSAPSQPLCWWGAACNLIPSRMQRGYPIAGLHSSSLRRVRQFTIRELRGSPSVRLSRHAVAQALTSTRLGHDELLVQRR